ncbi:tripartite tricarboxylate transporter substrate binding protein [Chelativorans sp. M5D2P16]|uniref:Bug family tripartite tricarboxylate transporter substrate binding protein n=1 Tax=Chelativorans sp. M5D2P16 TaxID=3095678 RepID=UPI002ACAC08E|nr:tripartite tricarboxylate transporter substrate binding protein [Chelativorans sp. M5D2P16]MDZ5696543.1 tripartite tricarboxylate transporter substrate binding protein [Chelativorans sp. M5D2P16]
MYGRFLTLLAVGTIGALMSSAALADYPEKDIRVIVPWGAGGGTDGIVRKLTSIAEKNLGTSMYVENIEGGISATGVSQVMNARPDGYTIGALTYDSVVTVPWQGLLPSYDLDKLKLIARVTSEPDAIIVGSDTPYETFDDLVAAAKENPGSVKVGIQNIGSRLHLAVLQLQDETDTEFKIIAYPGGAAPQKEAVLNDEVDVVATSLGDFAPLLESGDVRGILEFSETTNPTFNTVPTAKEAGLDLRIGSFIVFAAPAGTPDEAVEAIEQAYKEALESDEFQNWVASVGVTPDWLGTDEVTRWADETSETLFDQMDMLVEQGVIKK